MNQGCFQFARLHDAFNEMLSGWYAGAVFTEDAQALHVKYTTLADIGTFPIAAQTCQQYLRLNDGDIAVTNDPYSGGTILSSLKFVMGVKTAKVGRSKGNTLLVALRLQLKPSVILAEKLDQEGMRIPPTPIATGGQVNFDLVKGIAEHAPDPSHFEFLVRQVTTELLRIRKKVHAIGPKWDLDFSPAVLRAYLSRSQQQSRELFRELAVGESQTQTSLEDGSKIKLRTEVSDQGIRFDFSGTEASQFLHLTDSATLGACAGAILALFEGRMAVNSGFLDSFEIRAPSGSSVHAKYPQPVHLGMTDGTVTIANLVLHSLANIDREITGAVSGVSQCAFEIEFEGRKKFYESLETGSGASLGTKGLDGLNPWRRSHLDTSIEEIEKRFPVLIRAYSFRPNSGGGQGESEGGWGLTKSVEVLEPAKLRWMITDPNFRHSQEKRKIKPGDHPEIMIKKAGKEKLTLSLRGEHDLSPGDVVVVSSAGGEGLGE